MPNYYGGDAEASAPLYDGDGKYAFQFRSNVGISVCFQNLPSFSEESIRANFVKKVFLLITFMVMIVAVMSSLPFLIPEFGEALYGMNSGLGLGIVIGSSIAFISLSCVLSCCEGLRRSYPINLILLFCFTLAAGGMTMMVTGTYKLDSVLLAFIMTTGICAAIVIFAATIKKDLTSCLGVACLLGFAFLFFSLFGSIASIWFRMPIYNTIYSGLGAALMMFYLAIDIQLLMGGRRYEIDPEDHIFAAMTIFLDILNIFLYLLRLVGDSR